MTRTKFLENKAKGQVWEDRLCELLQEQLSSDWAIIDNRNVYRDYKQRARPDFTVMNKRTHEINHYDAKHKSAYKGLFTLDATKTESYRGIAKETNQKVFLAYWDSRNDPDHYYVLDIMTPETDTFFYDNEYTKDGKPTYRWHKNLCFKYKI